MSYVREDDTYERGRLSELRERLSGEVAAQWGEPFLIFQDRENIAWGQQWQERLDESLDSVTFLIPIVTPRFFRSPACRAEIERFLKREQELGRGDLILPIYYIDAQVLNDPAKRSRNSLAKVIHGREYWDWRPLRFKLLTSEQVGETIAKMAAKIIAALERPAAATLPKPSATPKTAPKRQAATRIAEATRLAEEKREADEAAAKLAEEQTHDRAPSPPLPLPGSEPERLYPPLPARRDSERWKNSVLWVNKNHALHTLLRQDFEAVGMTFTSVESINEAFELLSSNKFAAIISDVNHPAHPRAGYALLNTLRKRGDQTPFFFFAAQGDEHEREARENYAQGSTEDYRKLFRMIMPVLSAIR